MLVAILTDGSKTASLSAAPSTTRKSEETVMNWEDRIRKSDAGKLMPKRAEEIVKAAKEQESPKPAVEESFNSKSPTVLRNEFS